MTTAYEYASQHKHRFLQQLLDLTAIPSVGTDPHYAQDTLRAAEFLAEDMRRIGLHEVAVMPTNGQPIVYGEWLQAGPEAPTVLIYAHYDVQPAAIEDGWTSDPFVPVECDGKIYGRGIADDKSHTIMTLKAVESLLASDEGCPINVKFLLEGEEEGGSPNLLPFIQAHRDKLTADLAIIADGGLEKAHEPMIIYALRGIISLEVRVTGPRSDLHSGVFGGIVHNPAQVIAEIVAQLHHADGSVAVPGFYDDVEVLSDEERTALNKTEFSQQDWDDMIGAPQSWGEPSYTLVERRGARPTLEINGIWGGYTGEGFKTVIPSQAAAKISCRLVANQNPQTIYNQVAEHIRQIAPPTVTVEVTNYGMGSPIKIDINNPFIQAFKRAYSLHWDTEVMFKRTGGTIPIVGMFSDELGVDGIPLGFSLEDSGIHGPNENYVIDLFYKGVDTTIRFLQEIAQV